MGRTLITGGTLLDQSGQRRGDVAIDEVEAYIDVDPVAADLDVVAYLSYGTDQFYATCAEAANPEGARKVLDMLTSPAAAKAYADGGLTSRLAAG